MQDIYLYNKQTKEKQVKLDVCVAFAGIESFALSSLGYLWIYKTLDEIEDISVSRLTSDTESAHFNIKHCNLIAFSFSFDLDFLTFLAMFDKHNIPYKTNERGEDYPLICAGGPVVTANPEPYKDIFDFFIIGDGEDVTIKLTNIIKNNKDKSKSEILKLLSELEGIYVPNLNNKKVVKITKKLTDCIYTPILSENAFFKHTFIVEVERGCSNCCGFCLASYLNLPIRFMPYESLRKVIDMGLTKTNKIALLGAQISAYPYFEEICDYIYNRIASGEHIEMSISSLRVDAVKPNIVKTLVVAGQKNSTLAIEAGSERLRKVINKHITESQILEAVKIAKESGLKGLKFYGMIGLPTENQDDLNEIVSLAKKIKSANKGFNISFGFSTFVPKPHTPFQWFGRDSIKSIETKSNFLKKELHKLGIKSTFSSAKWDYWQAVLSRGDNTLTDFIIEVYKLGGKLGAFNAAAKKYNINADKFANSDIAFEKDLPWDFIDIKPGKEFLINENKRLLSYTAGV
ncbi:MAG: B12-binding domain-containing radical SAM protein [Clostridiaceae bacterium]|jgi:radical SAM superfamily enzyme YgiQ (UPF0313 family)|nr:B12-binding domain-containing radical SAM protein [Clostridiaceae bacterium]